MAEIPVGPLVMDITLFNRINTTVRLTYDVPGESLFVSVAPMADIRLRLFEDTILTLVTPTNAVFLDPQTQQVYGSSVAIDRNWTLRIIEYQAEPIPKDEYPAIVEPGPVPVPVKESPDLPWGLGWLKPWLEWATRLTEWAAPILDSLGQGLQILGDSLVGIPQAILDLFISRSHEVSKTVVDAGSEAFANMILDIASGSPIWTLGFTPEGVTRTPDLIERLNRLYDPLHFTNPDRNIIDRVTDFKGYWEDTFDISRDMGIAGIIMEVGTLGQIEGVMEFVNMLDNLFPAKETAKKMRAIQLDKAFLKAGERFYNSMWTPEIPPYADLINMVVKEKITLKEFTDTVGEQGFNSYWANKIWDAHFEAPSLMDIVTAYRRQVPVEWKKFGEKIGPKVLTESDVKDLSILVDLDPIFWTIFKERLYEDPTIRQARYLYETNAIKEDGTPVDREDVKEIVRRRGFPPKYLDAMTDYLVKFQERPWRRAYLDVAGQAYRKGVISRERLDEITLEAGFNPAITEWIVKEEGIRQEMEEAKVLKPKEGLLTLSYVKDLFIHNDIDEDYLALYFAEKGYDTEEIRLAAIVLNRQKAEYVMKGGV